MGFEKFREMRQVARICAQSMRGVFSRMTQVFDVPLDITRQGIRHAANVGEFLRGRKLNRSRLGLFLLDRLVMAFRTIEMLTVFRGVFFDHIGGTALRAFLVDRFVPGCEIALGIVAAAPERFAAPGPALDDVAAAAFLGTLHADRERLGVFAFWIG